MHRSRLHTQRVAHGGCRQIVRHAVSCDGRWNQPRIEEEVFLLVCQSVFGIDGGLLTGRAGCCAVKRVKVEIFKTIP